MIVDLDGRQFTPVAPSAEGEVGPETLFEFEQRGSVVSARYSGGNVVLGFLVGTLHESRLEFRYVQLDAHGSTASGHSIDTVETLADGRLALHEQWEWESRGGSGRSVLEEVRAV